MRGCEAVCQDYRDRSLALLFSSQVSYKVRIPYRHPNYPRNAARIISPSASGP
jgi:hypothetical protein